MSAQHLLSYLPGLPLTRLGDDAPAGLLVVSLPVPRQAPAAWSLNGQPTHAQPLGHWPGEPSPGPRRLLLGADAGGRAPEVIHLTEGRVPPDTPAPTAEMVVFDHADIAGLGEFYYERSYLKINWGGRWFGLAMGMRVRGEVHWWEHCQLVVRAQSPAGLEIEMGGNIPWEQTTLEALRACPDRGLHPHIHRHNALSAHVYARLHANGVCEIYAHHINSMFVDDGGDLPDAVPVLGLCGGDPSGFAAQCGVWDGARTGLQVDGTAFDLTDVAHLATPEQPGRVDVDGDFLVLQPYLGVAWYGGPYTEGRLGSPWYCRAEQQRIPRGFARTLRFSASLNPARPPRVARYLAPAWWYGVCEEFLPRPLLPVSNLYDATLESARRWFHRYMIPAGYEEGILPNQHRGDPAERTTPAAEGDAPGAMFLIAYRTGDPQDYDGAMRASYAFLDVFVDHAVKRVRMQGYPPPTGALPLMRMQSGIFAWLESGDPYCLLTAETVLDAAYAWHKNSWPRSAVGRDARFVPSLVLLYRYNNDRHSLQRARDVIADVGAAQWPDGSFGDQGGGAGIHGAAAYLAKPWMSWLATFGVLDYLECVPDDAEAQAIVTRCVNWLMAERAPRRAPDGRQVMGWTYQHAFRGKPLPDYTPPPPPTPGMHLFHFDYLARLLPWMSFRTGDPAYFDAWAESYDGRGPERSASYWEGISAFLFLPWLQARLWQARLTPDGVALAPAWFGPRTPAEGVIHTPAGPLPVAWRDGAVHLPEHAPCPVVLHIKEKV